MMLPIPHFEIDTAEKFYLASNFIQNFLKGTIFLSCFSVQLIAPQFKLVTDQEIVALMGYSPGPITDFGIGEPCLYELKQGEFDPIFVIFLVSISTSNIPNAIIYLGVYLRRGCFLACDIAKYTKILKKI